MKIALLLTTALFAAMLFTACGSPAANNSAANNSNNSNKPANSAGANNSSANTGNNAAGETDVKKFVGDFEAALNTNNPEAIGKFYDDTYTLIDQNGRVQSKSERLEAIKSGKAKWDGLKFSDVKVRMHPAGDGAVVSARATGKSTIDGKSEERTSMVTLVARKGPEGWKFIHAQITEIKGGAPSTAANTSTPANK